MLSESSKWAYVPEFILLRPRVYLSVYALNNSIASGQVKRKNGRRHNSGPALQFLPQQSAPAMQSGLDRFYSQIQRCRGFIHVQSFDDTQNKDGSIMVGQSRNRMLQDNLQFAIVRLFLRVSFMRSQRIHWVQTRIRSGLQLSISRA